MNSPVLITLIICIVIVIITLLISLCIVYRVKRQHDEKVAEFQRKRNAVAGSNAKQDKNNITVSPKSSNSSIAKDELELASNMPDDRNNININDNDGNRLQMTQPGLKVKKSTDGKAAYQSVGL